MTRPQTVQGCFRFLPEGTAVVALSLAICVGVGCGDSPPTRGVCAPVGARRACLCVGSIEGRQECLASGVYARCDCSMQPDAGAARRPDASLEPGTDGATETTVRGRGIVRLEAGLGGPSTLRAGFVEEDVSPRPWKQDLPSAPPPTGCSWLVSEECWTLDCGDGAPSPPGEMAGLDVDVGLLRVQGNLGSEFVEWNGPNSDPLWMGAYSAYFESPLWGSGSLLSVQASGSAGAPEMYVSLYSAERPRVVLRDSESGVWLPHGEAALLEWYPLARGTLLLLFFALDEYGLPNGGFVQCEMPGSRGFGRLTNVVLDRIAWSSAYLLARGVTRTTLQEEYRDGVWVVDVETYSGAVDAESGEALVIRYYRP